MHKSLDAYPAQPEPVADLRLALVLDKQEKYRDALIFANQAVNLTKAATRVGDAARQEEQRLTQLNGGSIAAMPKN